jgi:hypothetical protein
MPQLKTIYTIEGETRSVANQWAAETESRGTTIASSTWTYSGAGSLSGASLATPLASVTLAATGGGLLRNTVTLANGEVLLGYREVIVTT